jgi:hypothetical protein
MDESALQYQLELYQQPGLHLPKADAQKLRKELLVLGSICLKPLPDYQVFSSDPAALDDKIIVTAHVSIGDERRLVGFTSAVVLDLQLVEVEGPVLHGGLTVIEQSHRKNGLVVQLWARLFVDIVSRQQKRIWITNLSGLPSMLAVFNNFTQNTYPSPKHPVPTKIHQEIAQAVSFMHRSKMLIASSALFDSKNFVFRGSNDFEKGRCFRKSNSVRQNGSPMSDTAHEYYADLVQEDEGDEVLQVGIIEWEQVKCMIQLGRFNSYREAANQVISRREVILLN